MSAWANYDIEEAIIEKTSLNYLYSILADRLELPMTSYQRYLLDLSEEIPVLAAGGYWTKDGDFMSWMTRRLRTLRGSTIIIFWNIITYSAEKTGIWSCLVL